jgi:hypothetical protein
MIFFIFLSIKLPRIHNPSREFDELTRVDLRFFFSNNCYFFSLFFCMIDLFIFNFIY